MEYLDDVIVFWKRFDQRPKYLNEVLRTLQNETVSLKLKKCEFFTTQVRYRGHALRPGQLAADKTRIKSLKDLQHPCTITELRSFSGLCNLHSRFISGHTSIRASRNKLLRQEMPTDLSLFRDEENQTFRQPID